MAESTPCPCNPEVSRADCCGPYLEGAATAPTAEALMRSRYSAFVEGAVDFIHDSLHERSRADHDKQATKSWAERSEWKGLEIVETSGGGENEGRGEVEFIARFRAKGELVEHHEIATFVKENGRWWFLEGRTPAVETVVRDEPKQGRNDPCACGSEKKFKKCCGK